MRTETVNIYKFSELSEEAKEQAINDLRDVNVNFEWWENVYEDANQVSIKITGFDIDRGNYCNGIFLENACAVANKIISAHGEVCETYRTAKQFISEWDALVEKHSDGINKNEVAEENEYQFDQEADELESEFKNSILEDYRIILQKEYEYQISDKAVKETIEANEYYEFYENGEIY